LSRPIIAEPYALVKGFIGNGDSFPGLNVPLIQRIELELSPLNRLETDAGDPDTQSCILPGVKYKGRTMGSPLAAGG